VSIRSYVCVDDIVFGGEPADRRRPGARRARTGIAQALYEEAVYDEGGR